MIGIKNTLLILLLALGAINFSLSAAGPEKQQKVVITGKVLNYNPSIPLSIGVNRIGFSGTEEVNITIDAEGNFQGAFETYIPVDAWVTYKANFLVVLNPGDSLYVCFDGAPGNRPDILSTIQFGGTRAETNRGAAKWQELYFSNPIYYDWDAKKKAVAEYEWEDYLKYNEEVRQKTLDLYQHFVDEYAPNEESKRWALYEANSNYYHNIHHYARDHREAKGWNIFEGEWVTPLGFQSRLAERLPIREEDLGNGYSLRSFQSDFSGYVYDKMRAEWEEGSNFGFFPGGGIFALSSESDSIYIKGIIDHVKDPLIREIMLTHSFTENFESQNIAPFEKHQDIVKKYITSPFLKEPLYREYKITKDRIENPVFHTKSLLKDAQSLSIKDIFSEILETNKGKVIYIDFWAVWCGPCLSEMPNSKQAERELEGEDVSFVYICLQSDEEKYRANIAKYELKGQHYLLSEIQSGEMQQLFDFNSIPNYILIDKDGTIVEQGGQIRPLVAKEKIKELLRK